MFHRQRKEHFLKVSQTWPEGVFVALRVALRMSRSQLEPILRFVRKLQQRGVTGCG